ncbi:MAG: SusC/RagA family TonB-linked outer membrane protein, partial [Cyclobacteriaceae bacterium]
ILITTKKGTSTKPTFGFNTYTGFQAYGRKPDIMNGEQYVQKQLDFLESVGAPGNPDNPASFLQPDEIPNFQEGRTIDPWDQIKQDAPIYNVELSVSGKSERTNYFISGAYTNQKGLIANDNFERISARVNLDNKVTDWFTLGLNASFTQRDESGLAASIQQAGRLSPYGTMFNEDGSFNFFPQTDQLVPNPLMQTRVQNLDISQNLFSNAYAVIDFPFLEGLSYRLNFSNQFDWARDYRFEDDRTFDGRRNNGIGSRLEAVEQFMLIENILNYDQNFGDHSIGVTFLFSNDETNQRATLNEDQGFSNTVTELGFNGIGLGSQPTINNSETRFRRVSYMGRINYKYLNRYMFTFTARRDGYSGFGSDNKFGLFPTLALGWVLSEESFMQNIQPLDFLKIRASFGTNGNQAIDPYQSISRMEELFYIFGSTTRVGFAPSTIANPALGWETSQSFNIGADFSLFNERVSGAIEIYNTNTEDLLLRREIPIMTGFESIFDNIGATRNSGIEITLNTLNVTKEDFTWSSSFVFSRNVNEITGLYGTDINGDGVEDNDLQNGWFIGEPIDAVFDYELDGIIREGETVLDPNLFRPGFYRIVDQNDDGSITPEDDRTILGQREPDFRFGINNTFTYKNFTLNTFINSMVGGMILNPNLDFSSTFPGRANQLALDYWTPDNPNAEHPSIGYPNPFEHGVYDSRTFVRLQDVNLSYNIPNNVLGKLGMSNASIYISGKNLITLTNFHGWDPENGNAFYVADFPMPRIFTLGINGRF